MTSSPAARVARSALAGWALAAASLAAGACGSTVETADATGTSGSSSSTGGAPAGGGGAGGGAGGSAGGDACGDPKVAARLHACEQAQDETSCKAAGGDWTPVGPVPDPVCECPTGQDGCPCTRPSDCLAGCFAMTSGGTFACDGVTAGTCASFSITVGCWCIFDETGTPTGICID